MAGNVERFHQIAHTVGPPEPPTSQALSREWVLLAAHWCLVALMIPALLLVSSNPQVCTFLVIAALAVRNAAVGWHLRRCPEDTRLARTAVTATLVDWFIVFGTVELLDPTIPNVAPIMALTILVPAAIRFQFRGLIISGFACFVLVAGWDTLHKSLNSPASVREIVSTAFVWTGILAWLSVLWLAAMRTHQKPQLSVGEQAARTDEVINLSPQSFPIAREFPTLVRCEGLTARQCELLPLLARADLSYDEIGERLDPIISGRTVGSHVFHMGQELSVPGGRWAVVSEARRRGMLCEGTGSIDA